MLTVTQFTVGSLAQAQPLSLVLPRNEHEKPFIVGPGGGTRYAICLTEAGDLRFAGFSSGDAHNWRGMIVPDVQIEVDETSIYDTAYSDVRIGSLVRSGSTLSIAAKPEGWRGSHALFALVEGLPETVDGAGAGFTRWQIVIGAGIDKLILKAISVDPKT